jgi:YMGG-like Gly-zipper
LIRTEESDFSTSYNRLGPFAKLATSSKIEVHDQGMGLVAMLAVGCGTLTGAAVGAGSGAAIGAAAGDAKKGALIGAGVGAAGGAIYDATR